MILTNLSKRGTVDPVYIMKVISSPNKYSTHKLKDITIYGRIYHQFTFNSSTYPTIIIHIGNYWLIGEIMQLGGADEDVNSINKFPHWNVNIRDINNNEITSASISTIGALYHSKIGLVIVIMHQYEYHG